jgi:2-methylcitrate dehydratase PrpD
LENLIKKLDISPEDVKSIEVGVNEGILLHGGTIFEPTEVIEAQFSLRFSLALRLLKRSNDFRFYLDPKLWSDAAILAVGKKITLVADPSAQGDRRFACRIKIKCNGGEVVEGELAAPKGTSRNPLSKDEVTEKFLKMGSAVLPNEKLRQVVEKIDNVETEGNMSSLVGLLAAK